MQKAMEQLLLGSLLTQKVIIQKLLQMRRMLKAGVLLLLETNHTQKVIAQQLLEKLHIPRVKVLLQTAMLSMHKANIILRMRKILMLIS
jgi:hypothetical protein